jgi:hypothetical protein
MANAVLNEWRHISQNFYDQRLMWEQADYAYKNMCEEKTQMLQSGAHPASLGEQNELIECTRKLAKKQLAPYRQAEQELNQLEKVKRDAVEQAKEAFNAVPNQSASSSYTEDEFFEMCHNIAAL